MDLDREKSEFRQRIKMPLRRLTEEQRASQSRIITDRVVGLPEFAQAKVVMIFLSMQREVDTSVIAQTAWTSGKRVLAPRLLSNPHSMIGVEIASLTSDLVTSGHGFREPLSQTAFPIREIDLVLVPGLGFDRRGNRIGRGGGYYDGFLANSEFRGCACAVAFEEQVSEGIPVGPLDRPVDILVTEAHVYRFAHRREQGPTT